MRSLVIAADYPWPNNSGSRIRLASTLQALRACGDVDLFAIVSRTRQDFDPPPEDLGLSRVERCAIDDRPPSPARFVRSVARATMPFEVPLHARPVVSGALRRFASGDYDLWWFFRVGAWVLAGRPDVARAVVDLDDLEDQKILARISIPGDGGGGVAAHLRAVARAALWHEEMRRWRVLHRRISRRVAVSLVCSELDAERAPLRGLRVLPNGYEPPHEPVGRRAVGDPPTVLFHGTLRYPPNADGARYLVEEVAPRLRALVPRARVRLVGLASATSAAMDDPPAVTLVGQVPDIADELARADLVVVPLRYGSGTRVKIIEAFAHKVPVVSTTIGAEGLDVRDGEHLLLADDASALARACARLLTDEALRSSLVDKAHALFLARYQASSVREEVVRIARGGPVKSLVVGQDYPWPPMYGSHLRLAQVVAVASELGDVDLFSLTFPRRTDPCDVPSGVALRRVMTVSGPTPDYSLGRRLQWLTRRGVPLELAATRPAGIAAAFDEWADERYDFVWISKAATYAHVGRPRRGPTVVDFDDLEDQKIRARLTAMGHEARSGPRRDLLHYLPAAAQAGLNVARWGAFQVSVASAVDRVVVCSELDAGRLAAGNARIVPNGYVEPEHPAGRLDVGTPATVMLQGSLRYGPNADAAHWLAREIAPLIRLGHPGTRVRLVGETDGAVVKLHHPPDVTVVGRVPSMVPELARADLVAVPIRYGSGTRLKILEAFAHRIPVVSTTIGAEGLEVRDHEHLLVADDAARFAAACVRLLEEPGLRRTLVDAAHRLFLERYQWSTARAAVRALALELSGRAPG